MSRYQITAAVVGAGFIGPVHVEALRRLGISISGILGADRTETESARDALNLPRGYQDFDEILNDGSVDSIHLAVPNVLHYEMAKKAIAAGKHVLCEKPLAMNSNQSAELVELADSSPACAGVCYNVRFYPLNLQARHLIHSGHLGQIFAINGSYTQDWLLYDTDYNWRVLAEQGGDLRAVADIGTHWMDLVCSITGTEIAEVFADLDTVHPIRHRPTGEVRTFSEDSDTEIELEPIPIATDDYGCLLFRFRNGGRGSLWVSQVSAGRKNCIRYEIAGSKACLAWDSENPNQIWMGQRSSPNQALLKDPSLLEKKVRRFANYPGGHNEGFPDSFKQLFRAFYDVVSGKTDEVLFPTFADGHREVVLCEAVLKSNQTQKWVKLTEV